MPSKYHICTTLDEVKRVIEWTKETKYCSLDFETTGKEFAWPKAKPTIIGISFQIGSSYIIPLGHFDSPFKKNWKEILQLLSRELFENEDIVKIAWNMKFEHKWLLKYGCNFKGRCFDGMLAKYTLDEEKPNDLKSMVQKFYPEYGGYEDKINTLVAKYGGWAFVPLKPLSKYCGVDCDLTLRLMCFFEKKLIETGLYHIFRNLLMPASTVLAESEFYGMHVDVKYLDELIKTYEGKIAKNERALKAHKTLRRFERVRREEKISAMITAVKNEIKSLENSDKPTAQRLISNREEKISRMLAGEFTNKKERQMVGPVNFNSPKQLNDFFFFHKKGMRFPILTFTKNKQTKQDTTTPSTAEDALEKLRVYDKTGFIDQLLDHRTYTKLYSTYMVGTKELITPDNKVHANFKIHGTVTGRLSCSDPNLQNIPRDTTASDIKKMFIPPPGYAILQIDYSQAELRVMAEAANEESMLEWFNSGKDIHLASACKKYNVPYDKALKIYEDESHKEFKTWKKRRKQAKTINFGIIYCQTAKKLAQTLSEPAKWEKGKMITPPIVVKEDEAKEFLDSFNRDFPRVIKFMKTQKILAAKQGYVKTFFGRKRRLPNIYDQKAGVRMEAERQSVNAPIQGTASDFALFSSILIREHVLKNNKKEWGLKQIYTVHDSLGYLVKIPYIHEVVPILNHICENPQTQTWFGFKMKKVKMAVDFEVSNKSWGDLMKYNKETNYIKQFASKQ